MGIQSQLDQQAIDMLPEIKTVIESADSFESNQMRCHTIQQCLNVRPCIEKMNAQQLLKFQDNLLDTFKNYEWL